MNKQILEVVEEVSNEKGVAREIIFEALEELMKDTSVYDFLRLPAEGDYRDVRKFMDDVAYKQDEIAVVVSEVLDSERLYKALVASGALEK